MSVSINYKNNEILSIPSSGDYKLNTKGKYLEDDIRITATGGITPTGNINITQAGQTDVTNYATATVPAGTEGTPSATKGTVSNHAVTVTPSVTNASGWIDGGTHTGTAVTVGASELVSGTYTVDSAGTKDVTNYASASIPSASLVYPLTIPIGTHEITVDSSTGQIHSFVEAGGNVSPISQSGFASSTDTVFAYGSGSITYNLPTQGATTITPSTSAQTAVTAGKFTTGAVTVSAMPSGTAGTPTATKGTVSNHSVTVTPSVTNTAGYISGGTKTGTAVTVSASELVSGSQTISQNGTVDVTNLASIVVDVQGGGSTGPQIGGAAPSNTTSSSITFTGLNGEPTSFFIYIDGGGYSLTSTSMVESIVFDGTSLHGQTVVSGTNAVVYDGSSFSKSYSNGTLTVTSSGPSFYTSQYYYMMDYSYGGSSANIDTKDVQVGSGATSITFTGLDDEPIYWSCIFKSNFSTSSGYQRVIWVAKGGYVDAFGHSMDSAVRESLSYWTPSYSNGNLTITSQGTNQGGYFHQPGYYQLTAVYGDVEPQEIDVVPLSVTQNGTYTAQSGTAYSPVTVNVSGGGANIATATMTNSSNQNTSIAFTLPSGRTPKAFFARLTSQIARSSNSRYYYVFDMRWDGSSTGGVAGNTFYMYNGTLTNVTSGYSYSQSGTTFTLSSTGARNTSPGSFYNGTYELVYVY